MSLVGMPGYQETPAGWIPHDWMATTLGAVADFKGGNAFKEKFQGKKAGDFPFIKVSDFSLPLNQKFIRVANNWIDADTNKEIKATLFEQGAVVFAKVGAALLLNRRRVLTRKTAIDNNLMAATPRTIDPTFLYFHLQTVDFGKLVQDGAVPSVNQGQLQALPLAQPPLAEQQKVAAILTAVDDKLDVIPSFLAVDACIHDGFLALINIDEASASKNYLYHVISSLKQRLDASATHGGVFTNLTTTILKEFRLPLPSIAEQEKIAAALDAVDDKLAVAVKRHQRFQTLKRGLMQKLLTGEWRVSVDSGAPGT